VVREDLVIAASFDPPDAHARYARWRELNAELLKGIPPDAVRVDTGRAISGEDFIRVWLPPDVATRPSPGESSHPRSGPC
jgi:hypothetical protein